MNSILSMYLAYLNVSGVFLYLSFMFSNKLKHGDVTFGGIYNA